MKSVIHIANLKCSGCAKTINNKLLKLSGINSVVINQADSSIEVVYPQEDDLQMIKRTLRSLGYPEINEPNLIAHKAKSYTSCLIGKMTTEKSFLNRLS